MIHEFAIEPELLMYWGQNRQEYRLIYDKFGLGQPRVLSEYPKLKHWRRNALRAVADTDDFTRIRVEELVKCISECVVKRNHNDYDGTLSWLENAETSHEECPFHLILARDNPRNSSRVRSKEVIAEPNDEPWCLKRTFPAPRTSEDLAQVLEPMLSNCSKVYFIDPYFDPSKKKYQDNMRAFLASMVTDRPGPVPETVVVITDRHLGYTHFKDHCERNFKRLIPKGLTISFVRYEQQSGHQELHNRYVLTDIGGALLGRGLDRSESGPDHSEDMALFEKDHCLLRWKQYVDAPVFRQAADEPVITIEGMGHV